MTTVDPNVADMPESTVKRPEQLGSDDWIARKLTAWGIDPKVAASMPVPGDELGDKICRCDEPGCTGSWRVLDPTGSVWLVRCDACGFEAGIPPQDAKLRAQQLLSRANLPERFVGLVFEEDDDNRDALYLLRSWLADFGAERANGADGHPGLPALALWGEPGTGKTHLLTALCFRLIREQRVNVMFRSVRELLRELQRFDNEVQRTEVWERARTVQVLALDDLGAERITDWRLEQLAELIDARYLAELPILLTTNFPPRDWDEILDERSRDRLLGRHMVVPVQLKGRDRNQAQLDQGAHTDG